MCKDASCQMLQVQILLQKRGLSLNPITTMYYIAPVSFAFLSLPWGVIEARQLFYDEKVCFAKARNILIMQTCVSLQLEDPKQRKHDL